MKSFGLSCAKLIALILFFVPRFVQRAFAWGLVALWWDVFRLRRFTVYRNITLVFPHLSHDERRSLARKSLFWMAYHFFEFLRLPNLSRRAVKRRAVYNQIENYDEARRMGKGVFFLSLHLGGGDVATAMLSQSGFSCHLISKKFKAKFLNDFWFGVREDQGTHFIDPHGAKTAFDILKAIRAKEIVIFILDQFMGKPFGIQSTFFGKKTGTAYGLALFSLKTGAPVVPVYTVTDGEGKVQIYFEKAIDPFVVAETSNRDLQISQLTARYNEALEKIILRQPEQWMWVHRRWKRWE